jgi:transposase
MELTQRQLGLDVHRQHVMIAAVNNRQDVLMPPVKVAVSRFAKWAQAHLQPTDRVALEATSNAWAFYDMLEPLVAEAKIADGRKIKLISASRTKTDKHDALVLAQLLASNLLPAVWVPPVYVRELRSLTAHRRRLVRERSAAKNRLHGVLHRHNLILPPGDPFSDAHRSWWASLAVSPSECLRIRHEWCHIQHLTRLIEEVEAELAQQSAQAPWCEQVAFLVQLPGIGLNSALTILAAIGDIDRFASAKQLVGYAGLGASVYASGQRYHTGKITKQGRRELRAVLVESAWVAVSHSASWKQRYQKLLPRLGKHKAIVAIARKLLVSIWHVLTKRVADRHADVQAVARSLMTWATQYRLATSLGMTRPAFVKRELERLGLASEVDRMRYGSKTYHIANLRTYTVKQGTPVSVT